MSTASAFRIAALVVVASTRAEADGVSLTEKPDQTTEAVVTVDAPPDQVYALATDYAHWQGLLTDVTSVKLETGGREDARLWFDSRAIDHRVLVQFDNVPNQVIRFRGIKGPPGGRARGEYRLEPVDNGTRTRITASLYLDVKGPVGWLVSDRKLRTMRQTKLRADLGDVERHFRSVPRA